MIDFACGGCGATFYVPDEHAGKSAKCRRCGTRITVPNPPADPVVAGKLSMRQRRLIADAKQMRIAFSGDGPIRLLDAEGDAPEKYRLAYSIRGLDRNAKGEIVPRDTHEVEIELPADYPRLPPHCRMLTTIFHPNIDRTTICIGDHWAAGERLADLAVRVGEMIAFQAYNIKSPLDGEAAMWADLNREKLPIDPRPIGGR